MCALCEGLCDKGDCVWQKSEITISFFAPIEYSKLHNNCWYIYIMRLADHEKKIGNDEDNECNSCE